VDIVNKFLDGSSLPIVLGYGLAVFSLIMLYLMMFVHKNHVLEDLRGPDKMWQFIELTAIIWMILMPMMVVCDLLGVHATNSVWTSMDAIYLINVGGKVTSKYFDSRKDAPAKREKKDDEPVI
jgi:hypothetical protein